MKSVKELWEVYLQQTIAACSSPERLQFDFQVEGGGGTQPPVFTSTPVNGRRSLLSALVVSGTWTLSSAMQGQKPCIVSGDLEDLP